MAMLLSKIRRHCYCFEKVMKFTCNSHKLSYTRMWCLR